MSFWSSSSVIGWSGFLRSWLWVVVKPLTSSPAMPIDDLASAGTRPSPRPPGGRPRSCRRRPRCPRRSPTACATAPAACDRRRGRCPAPRRRSRRRAPWRTRCRCRARCRSARLSASSRCQIRRQKAISASDAMVARTDSRTAAERVGQSLAARPHAPGPSPGGRRPCAPIGPAAALTRSPAAIPRSTRSSDTVTKTCGASASRASAITPDAEGARGRPWPRP